jgi:hypothetical protein
MTASTGAPHSATTARIQRRLERWELEHLRQLAADLAERIDELEHRLIAAEDSAEFWRESHHRLEEHLLDDTEDARCIGLTREGSLLVVRTGAAS